MKSPFRSRSAHGAGAIRLLFLAMLLASGCGQATPGSSQAMDPVPELSSADGTIPPPSGGTALVAPLWEQTRPLESLSWTAFAYQVVQLQAPALLAGTADITNFCAAYPTLNLDQRISFWVYLFSAVAKFESNFDPASRMRESGLGTDPITKLPVYSEGLLQLSYQDVGPYPFCNEFNWSKDKSLAPNDPRKSILDPFKNLSCGIRILNQIVGKKKLLAFNSGQYWSTLMPSHRYGKVKEIEALTRTIAFCRK